MDQLTRAIGETADEPVRLVPADGGDSARIAALASPAPIDAGVGVLHRLSVPRVSGDGARGGRREQRICSRSRRSNTASQGSQLTGEKPGRASTSADTTKPSHPAGRGRARRRPARVVHGLGRDAQQDEGDEPARLEAVQAAQIRVVCTAAFADDTMSSAAHRIILGCAQGAGLMDDKYFHDSGKTSQLGVNLIERTVLRMGHVWRPIQLHDVGIDGEIELKDPRTGTALHRLIRVQVKTRSKFTRDSADGFDFACTKKDVAYWLRSPVPVLLVCVHAQTEEMYFVCVTEYFIDAARREPGRVRFDKSRDRFDENVGPQLVRLAGGPASAAVPPPMLELEALVSNLLPVVQSPDRIWAAPTGCRTPEQAHARFQEAAQGRASDYLLRDGELYSLRDPRTCPLLHLIDGEPRSFPTAEWADSENLNLRNRYSDLLRRALLQQVKQDLRWQPDRKLFYFRAPRDPIGNRFIAGARKQPRQVVWAERFTTEDGEVVVSYVRHHAFAPRFLRLDGHWYLCVEPTYYYSWNGERESARADVLAAGMKRLERNGAVLGSLRMWERWLMRPPSLLEAEAPLLIFGPAETVDVDRRLDEKRWNGEVSDGPGNVIPGQEQMAA